MFVTSVTLEIFCMTERQGRVSAERIISENPRTRPLGRQHHDDILTNVSSRIVAAIVFELGDFIGQNESKSWPAAVERAERKTFKILQENKP